MAEQFITNGILIDDAEAVLEGIQNASGKKLSGIETVIRFINEEKNTKFYLDSKMKNCSCTEKKSEYLWLDTGFLTINGNAAIFISMKWKGGMFIGHYIGTADTLSYQMRSKVARASVGSFKDKYTKKISERKRKHILNEYDYLLGNDLPKNSEDTGNHILASLITTLGVTFPDENESMSPSSSSIPKSEEASVYQEIIEEKESLSKLEEEITIDLLLEKIDSMQSYMDELVNTIEELNAQSQMKDAEVDILKARNEEYKRAMVQMRLFIGREEDRINSGRNLLKSAKSHELLEGKRILVLGDCKISNQMIRELGKLHGYDDTDFIFETDYEKVVSYTDRIKNGGRYYAIIFGACPHKAKGIDHASSIISKCKQEEGMPFAADARSTGGQLKASKTAVEEAILKISHSLVNCQIRN